MYFSKKFELSIFITDSYETTVSILGLKTVLKHFKHYNKKYLSEIKIIFLDYRSISKAKSNMKPKFPVPVHHDLSQYGIILGQ